MSITFSSCFYIIKSKFNPEQYVEWMNNFISIVHNFNLVIYTDENSMRYIDTKNNSKIKVIIKPIEQFYNYKYKDFWIENHTKNNSLNDKSCWELNMLWSEKISFVKETFERKYFDTEFYGWCDIGYFRNRIFDTHTTLLNNWPDLNKIHNLDQNKIVYGCVCNNDRYMNRLKERIMDTNESGLPKKPISHSQVSIAGGFFILHKQKIDWWFHTFDSRLFAYFLNNYLVKDDQIIILDCITNNLGHFSLFRENILNYDNWFMFQRILN